MEAVGEGDPTVRRGSACQEFCLANHLAETCQKRAELRSLELVGIGKRETPDARGIAGTILEPTSQKSGRRVLARQAGGSMVTQGTRDCQEVDLRRKNRLYQGGRYPVRVHTVFALLAHATGGTKCLT